MIRSSSARNKNKKVAVRAISTVMTALMLLFLTTPAFSAMRTPIGSDSTLEGKVVAVQNMSDLTVLTIQTAKGIDNEVNVLVAPSTRAHLCSYSEHAVDVNPGDNAVIQYHTLSGLTIADRVSEKC